MGAIHTEGGEALQSEGLEALQGKSEGTLL